MPISGGICHSLACSALLVQPKPLEWEQIPSTKPTRKQYQMQPSLSHSSSRKSFMVVLVQCWSAGSLQHSEKIRMALPMQLVPFGREVVASAPFTRCTYYTSTILVLEYKCSTNGRNSRIELLIDEQAHKRKRITPFKRANLGNFSILLPHPLLIMPGLNVGG